MSERGSSDTSERDQLSEIIFMSLGFTAAIGALRKLWGFLLYGFPEEKFFVSFISCDYCYACYSLR